MSFPRRTVLIFSALIAAVCDADAEEWKASTWSKADAMFHSDRRWLGGDAAFSVPLPGARVLWLFGDSFIGDGRVKRAKSTFVHNSVGVQQGLDPSRAKLQFLWRETNGRPSSYFTEDGAMWFWPLHGIVRDGSLTLFFMKVVASKEGLGFNVVGTAAQRCDDISGDPGMWSFRPLTIADAPAKLDLLSGVAILEDAGHLLAYCAVAPGNHDVYLQRWRGEDFDRGDLSAPQWWDGTRYVPQRELTGAPAVIMPHAQTEFSVSRLPDGRYVETQTLGFGATDVGLRFAPRPEGPWSAPQTVFRPRESRQRDTYVYAGKAHPELEGAPLIVTYAANHHDLQKLLRSKSLYYPRFVRLSPK